METTHPWPDPPDNEPKKENGPPLSANIEKDHQSIEAPGKSTAGLAGNQAPSDGELSLMEFAEAAPAPLDPEDLTSFAIAEDVGCAVTQKALTTVPVRKPPKEAFVRTLPDDSAWSIYNLLEFREEGRFFLLSPEIAEVLEAAGESTLIKARLVPTVDRRGNLFLWLLKDTENENTWHVSAYRAALLAREKWVRVQSNMSAGVYDTLVATNQEGEPAWPDEDYSKILEIAFEGRVIKERDHPVLKDLRGE